MNKLSITAAWNETADVLRRDFGALFTVAIAMIALPSVVFQALGPSAARMGQPAQPLLWLVLGVALLVLTLSGSIAISALALGREQVVGSAIAHGFRRFPSLLGATLLIALGAIILLLPFVLLAGVSVEDLATPTMARLGPLVLLLLIYCLILLFLWVKLMLMTPVTAAEAVGPIGIIGRSWALTAGHYWKLLGFVVLMVIVIIVVSIAVGAVLGIVIALILGAPAPGSLAGLVLLLLTAVVNAAVGVVVSTMVAHIYLQLAGGTTSGS